MLMSGIKKCFKEDCTNDPKCRFTTEGYPEYQQTETYYSCLEHEDKGKVRNLNIVGEKELEAITPTIEQLEKEHTKCEDCKGTGVDPVSAGLFNSLCVSCIGTGMNYFRPGRRMKYENIQFLETTRPIQTAYVFIRFCPYGVDTKNVFWTIREPKSFADEIVTAQKRDQKNACMWFVTPECFTQLESRTPRNKEPNVC